MRLERMGESAVLGNVPLDRRKVLAGGVAGLASLALPTPLLAAAMPRDRTFAILRDGDEIGRHVVRFTPTERGFRARTAIEIEVKVAFFTAFRFEQTADDLWIEGQLHESSASTDDNGDVSRTLIRATTHGLEVEGGEDDRDIRVPLGTMTDLAFWNVAILRQNALVDTQKVALTDVAARRNGTEPVETPQGRVMAEHFTVAAETGRSGEIWFDAAGNWVKGVMSVRGETLAYRLIA